MHIWLVTNLQTSPSTELVLQTCTELGWTSEHIVPGAQTFQLTASSIEELFFDRKVSPPDFCFIRMGSAAPIEGFALVEKIHSLGIPCFNSPATISRLRDKALGSCLMSAHEVPTPKTLVIGGQYSVDALTTCIEGPPWVLKTRFSAKGLGVMLVDSRRALGSAIDTLLASHTQILMQEFVPERSGTDVRVIVAGGKALAAMERGASSSTEFRSNLFLGGQGIAVPLTEELSRIAEVATAALGLTIAGVDLLGGPGGFVVAEANTSPGLAGVSQVQGRNIAHDVLLTFKEILSTFEKEE